MPDSVSLEDAAELSGGGPAAESSDKFWRGKKDRPRPRAANLKIIIALFLIFVLVVSDVFVDSVVGGFRGAVHCRAPTAWGVTLQAMFLAIFYILAVHLIDSGVL